MITGERPWYGYNAEEDGPPSGSVVTADTLEQAVRLLALKPAFQTTLSNPVLPSDPIRPISYVGELVTDDALRFVVYDVLNGTMHTARVRLDVVLNAFEVPPPSP